MLSPPAKLKLGDEDACFEAAELFLARLADEKRFPWWRGLILSW